MQDAHKANGRKLEQGRERWNRNKLAGQAATTPVTAISYSASISPLKLCLAEIPSPGRFISPWRTFSLPPPALISCSKAAHRSCSTPQSALLAQVHTWLTPVLTQTHCGIYFYKEGSTMHQRILWQLDPHIPLPQGWMLCSRRLQTQERQGEPK